MKREFLNLRKGFSSMLLWVFSLCAFAQDITVKGTVTGTSGESLIGVTVVVQGTATGTITNERGRYTLMNVPSNASLEYSYVGMEPQIIPVNGRTSINVVLREDTETLDEVVVVGYGTQKKRDLTGAIASVSGDDLGDIPMLSFDQALQGKIAGVQITQTNGAPGGNINVSVRGISSITSGNSPLYVVDGFPIGTGGGGSDLTNFNANSYTSSGLVGSTANKINPLSSINPNDIESIEVLKDASATAIYGSRGANGVVLITTKRGRQGKVNIDLNMSFGIQQVERKIEMMNSREFAEFVVEGRDNAWIYLGGSASDPNEARTTLSTWVKDEYRDPSQLALPGTDWQDVIYRTAPVQKYQLSVSGGNEKVKYLISGGYFNQTGIVIGSDYEQFNIRSNIDIQLTDRIKLGSTISGSHGYGDFARTEGHLGQRGLIQAALAMSPAVPVYDENGDPYTELGTNEGVPVENPINIARNFSDERNQTNVLTNNFLDFEIMDGLNFKTSIGVNFSYGQTKLWKSSSIGNGVETSSPATAAVIDKKGFNWLNENTLNWQKTFNDSHDLNVLGGLTVQKENFNLLSAGATDFPTDYVTYLSAGTINTGNHYDAEWSLASLLGRVNYAYNGKYMLTATIRRDGSSKFGNQNKWGTFPSISVGYRLSEEKFMRNIDFLSNLKIRLSYGESGNNLIGNYAHIGLLSPSNYSNNNGKVAGLATTSMENDNLTWEKSKQTNIGIDLGLFNGRISLVADAYRDYKTDLLLSVSLPSASGFTSSTQNIGEIENKGIEIGLNTENIISKNFRWSTSFNISANRNKVTKLNTKSTRISNSSYQETRVGSPIASFYLMNVLGVFKDQADVESGHPLQSPDVQPGDLKYKDVDNSGSITTSDKEIVGSPFPDFTWGLGNVFSYKNLSLSIFLNGSQGGKTYLAMHETLLNSAGVQNQLEMVNRRWRSESDPGDGLVPRAIRNSYALSMTPSTRCLFDASYIRIQDITLSYDFPKQLIRSLHMQGLNAYFNISNLHTFTDYPAYNPEASTGGDSLTKSGIDEGVYPLARTFSLGVKLSF